MTKLRSHLPTPLLLPLLALTSVAYWPALGGGFQFDDERAIAQNLAIKDLGRFVREHLPAALLREGRPLTDLTFALNYHFTGLELSPLHLTNLAVHLCAVALAFALARLAFARAGATRPGWPALAAAALFALHPLQTEAVSYLCQRAESLASALYLATLLALLAAGAARRRASLAGWLATAMALFVLALAAKPMVATLPAAFLLFTFALPPEGHRRPLAIRAALLSLPFFLLTALSAWLNLRQFGGRGDVGFDMPRVTPSAYLLTQPHAILAYLKLAIWPSGQSIDHDFPVTRTLDAPTLLAVGAIAAAVLLGAALLLAGRRGAAGPAGRARRLAGFGILFFFLCLLPTSSVIPLVDVMVEHRVYLALFGLALAAVGTAQWALSLAPAGTRAVATAAVALLVCAALGGALWSRNQVWANYESLWRDVAEKAPLKLRAHSNYGQALFLGQKYEEAIAQYQLALSLPPDGSVHPVELYRNQAAAYLRLGRTKDAARVLDLGLIVSPNDPDLLNNLAICLLDLGQPDVSAYYARRALASQPSHGGAHNTLGEALLQSGDRQGAFREFQIALAQDPDSAPRQFNVAALQEMMGLRAEACASWRRYLQMPYAEVLNGRVHLGALRCDP